MVLIQLFLPLYGNDNKPFSRAALNAVREELTERFGGVTAFIHSPAEGFWRDERDKIERDTVVIVEVMAPELDRVWWTAYRRQLEVRFAQQELVIRSMEMERL